MNVLKDIIENNSIELTTLSSNSSISEFSIFEKSELSLENSEIEKKIIMMILVHY